MTVVVGVDGSAGSQAAIRLAALQDIVSDALPGHRRGSVKADVSPLISVSEALPG